MPSRRDLVRTCGTAIVAAVAGCLDTSGDPSDGSETTRRTTGAETTWTRTTRETTTRETTATATATESTTSGAPTPPPEVREVDPSVVADRGVPRSPTIESDTYEPFRGFVVGERPDSPRNHYETPHVWVWNLTDEPTTTTVTLRTAGTELRRIEAEFPAGTPLAVAFRDRRTYELTVRVGERETTVTVGPDRFWCNASVTDVQVRPDRIEAGTVSTSMACTTTSGA